MYRPVKLQATDFQSFQTLSYDFQVGKAILIEGENKTDEGQATNGAGKSSFGEMIYYCLLGTSSTGKRDIKLVRHGCKQATLSLTLKNEFLKQELTINRTLFSNTKSSTLEIFINGQDQKNKFATVTEGNKMILDLLDISAEDLKNYYLVNRKRFVSFFDSPDSSKRSLLARFSNIDRIQKVSGNIDETLRDRQEEINTKSSNLISIQSKIDLLNQQIDEAKKSNAYEEKKQELEFNIESCSKRIASIGEEMKEKDREVLSIQKKIDENEKNLDSLNQKIKTLQSIDFNAKLQENSKKQAKLQEKIDNLKQQKRGLSDEVGSLSESLQPILVMLEGVVTCPNCKTEFSVADNSFNVEEAKALVSATQEALDEMEEKSKELESKIETETNSSAMKDLKLERQSILNDSEKNAQQILSIKKSEIAPINYMLSDLQRQMESVKQSRVRLAAEEASCVKRKLEAENNLKHLSKDIESGDVQKWNNQIKEYTESLERVREEINVLEGYNQKDKQWRERINQFYVYLTNKTLALIQSHCNYYLDSINSDLRLKFEGFKTLSDGKIKESINAVIMRNGEEEEDYRCFSGGEQGRLVFSTILTYQDLINQKSKSGGLDYLQIDEILDQTDSQGLSLFIKSLSPLDKTVFIISQVKTDAPVENTLLIVKEEGISRICEK